MPLDRNAKVRVMMVARALMRHQEKGKGLRQDQREGAGGAHRAALALPQRRDRHAINERIVTVQHRQVTVNGVCDGATPTSRFRH